ncbi:MAG TPA: hypothetical protein VMZ28_20705, partial [Kofleriaceae bacterium]|nr:hypothetical protein [Kofleriaceae bacterium]
AAEGAGAGSVIDLRHEVIVRDPITKEVLRDQFTIGQLTVQRSGDHVSVAHAPAELAKRVRAGDAVALASAPRRFVDPWQQRVAASRGAPAPAPAGSPSAGGAVTPEQRRQAAEAVIADAAETRAVWQATLGKAPAERALQWRALLERRPALAYAAAVRAEITSLEAQARALEAAAAMRQSSSPRQVQARHLAALIASARGEGPLLAEPPARVTEGQTVDLAFAVRDPAAARRAWLYVRTGGDTRFRRIELVADGDAYLRAAVPPDVVRQPRIDYFVEAAAGDGEPVPVVGSSEAPRSIDVSSAALDPPPELHDRSRITLVAEYVDFDGGLRDGFDQYYQVEADFMYRFLQPVYAMRLGFGTLSGLGGPKDIIDEDPDDRCRDTSGEYRCRRLSYSYIYTEIEHRFSKTIAVMLRPQAGLLTTDRRAGASARRCTGTDLVDCESERSLGMRARIRIGDEMGTNLALGVGVAADVGTLFEAAYASNALPRLPVRIAVQVTDQPIVEDFGVRLVGDVGFRPVPWLYPSIRVSYQARDVDHAGLSGGAGFNFDW